MGLWMRRAGSLWHKRAGVASLPTYDPLDQWEPSLDIPRPMRVEQAGINWLLLEESFARGVSPDCEEEKLWAAQCSQQSPLSHEEDDEERKIERNENISLIFVFEIFLKVPCIVMSNE